MSWALKVLQSEKDSPDTPSTSEVKPIDSGQLEEQDLDHVEFSAGNPRVEHITGVVHLYRNVVHKLPFSDADTSSQPPEEHGLELCTLAIPADMSVADFCRFCGAYLQQVKELRVLRREGVQRSVSMVLLTFSDQQHADSFYSDYNGKPFSSLEPEIVCRLVFVKGVEVVSGELPRGTPPPPAAHTELPSCPVCLERLDEHISGIVTTVCNHRFHGECLQKWGDTSCPVCRYCMDTPASTSACADCGTHIDLWICLICGHVGCGRYKSGHASSHWLDSQHCYALELETQRVWDYAGDGYVHRLIQSKTDGKLVEVPPPPGARRSRMSSSCGEDAGGSGRGEEGSEGEIEEALMASKIEAVAQEYNHLLATQLDSQRQYFEGLLLQNASEADRRCAEVEAAAQEQAAEVQAAQQARKEAERLRQVTERKLADATARAAKLQEEREFLAQLNESLLRNQQEWTDKVKEAEKQLAEKDATITDLQEQVRDLMMFIEGQKIISEASASNSELAGASLLPVPEPASKAGRRRSSTKK